MHWLSAEDVNRLGDIAGLVEALKQMNRRGADRVDRMLLSQPIDGGQNDCLLLPAWAFGRALGVKIANVFPGNAAKGLASVQGAYILFDGATGTILCGMDGPMLTLRKTAANSGLAADWLARSDAGTLAMLGAGALAPHLVEAHCRVRPIRRVLWWARRREQVEHAMHVAASLLPGVEFEVAPDVRSAVEGADVISAATATQAPIIRGEWLHPGQHIDLVGGYRPDMREADDACARRTGRLYVDARFTTIDVVGDVIGPMKAGLFTAVDIVDLGQIARAETPGRRTDDEITWFKSGGGGHEDLACADYLYGKVKATRGCGT